MSRETAYNAEPYNEVSDDAKEARDLVAKALHGRVHASVLRRTPFMSTKAANELAEDVAENVLAYLKGLFDL